MSALEQARLRLREKRAAGITVRRDPVEKARAKPNSLRLAVTAKCVECMGGPDVTGFRKDIRNCTSSSCPLYAVRPYQHKEEDEDGVSAEGEITEG